MIGTKFNYNTLKTSGDPKNSLNLVFLGDGFQNNATDSALFNNQVTLLMNYILANDPWKSKAYNLNFYSIEVPSAQSGITHLHVAKDCPPLTTQAEYLNASYFGLAFDSLNVHRFILPTQPQLLSIQATIIASMPNIANAININLNICPIIIVNDTNYGGSEFGACVVTTLHPLSGEIVLHELGHAIGALNDEYIGGSISNSWNTWTDNNPADVEWKSLLSSGAGIIQIGSESLWKGFTSCKMNTLGTDTNPNPYCLVCFNQLVKAINELITLAGGIPATGTVVVPQPPPPPPPPVNLSPITSVWLATGPSDSPFIEVNNVVGASGYIFTLTSLGLPTQTIKSNNVAYAKGLKAKTVYSVTVVAIVNGVNSLPSTPFTFTTP